MVSIIIASFFSAVCAALGLGGGTVLMLYFALLTDIPQQQAQGIGFIALVPYQEQAGSVETNYMGDSLRASRRAFGVLAVPMAGCRMAEESFWRFSLNNGHTRASGKKQR